MATEVKQPIEQTPGKTNDHGRGDRAGEFWSKNSRFLVYGLVAVVLIVAGYFIYQNYVKAPEERKAVEAMWRAEQYFRMDSARLALNGDGANQGFLRIISRYGDTKAGKLARFYAAASYMKLGDFNNAIRYLKDFSTDDKLIQARATGLLGDAYSEAGKRNEAAQAYRKAGTMFEEDDYGSPEYLFRAGLIYQDLGKNNEAIEVFRIIKDKYPTSQRGGEIDKYLARLGVLD